MKTTATLQEIRSWPIEDRLDLVFQAWDQLLDDGWQPTLADETKADLDRRWANFVANPGSGLTWEQVVAQVKRSR